MTEVGEKGHKDPTKCGGFLLIFFLSQLSDYLRMGLGKNKYVHFSLEKSSKDLKM